LVAACSAPQSVVSTTADADASGAPEAGATDSSAPPSDALPVEAATIPDAALPPVYADPNDPSQWSVRDTQPFSMYSAVFDGRYVYFPRSAAQASAEAVLRYDTQAPFEDDTSWTMFDTSLVPSDYWTLSPATFAGTHLYWGGTGFTAIYDTAQPFESPSSWAKPSIDAPYQNNGASAVSDGVDAYIAANGASGVSNERWIFRYGPNGMDSVEVDQLGSITFSGSAFDGRYVWFTTSSPTLLRIDTTVTTPLFNTSVIETASAAIAGSDVTALTATAFDGRFLYLLGLGDRQPYLLRYDTTAPVTAGTSWQRIDLTQVIGAFFDNYRMAFDGRNLYVLFQTSQTGPILVRYDTTKAFVPSSWTKIASAPFVLDSGVSTVFNAAAFDGKNLYFTGGGKIWRFRARDRGSVPLFMPGGTFN
jgi:hypothetical protein